MTELIFPSSIKKLCLNGGCLDWENVTRAGKMLPRLEVLRLDSVTGLEWTVDEGAFPRLKFLRISFSDLINWTADASHFPALEKLHLSRLPRLDEIPLDIGEIPTLGDMSLLICSESAAISATKILKEQLSLGNEDIQVTVCVGHDEEAERLKKKVEREKLPIKNFRYSSVQRLRTHFIALGVALRFRRGAAT